MSPALKRMRSTFGSTIVFAMLLQGVPAMASAQPSAPAATVMNSPGIPLTVALQAAAFQAHQRIFILPGTPNPTIKGTLVIGNTPGETLVRLLQLNGLVAHEHNGVLIMGTTQAIDSRFGSTTTHAELVPVIGLDPTAVATTLVPQLPAGTVVLPDSTRHSLYVSGTKEAIAQVKAFITPLLRSDVLVQRYPLHSSATPESISSMLEKLAPPSAPESVVVDPSGDAVLVAGPAEYQTQVQAALRFIDVDAPQIRYDIAVIEVDPVVLQRNLGILIGQSQTTYSPVGNQAIGQVSSPSNGSAIFGFPLNRGLSLNGQLDLLKSEGSARVVQRDMITAVNGEPVTKDYMQSVAYPVQTTTGFSSMTTTVYKDVGFKITLTPQIGDGTIGTKEDLHYSTITGEGITGAPNTATRDVAQRFISNDGETFMGAGMNAETFLKTKQGIPVLSELPIIGGLFSHTSDSEIQQQLVVLISATRIKTSQPFDPAKYPSIKGQLTPQEANGEGGRP